MIATLIKQPGEQLLGEVRFDRPIAWPKPATIVSRQLVPGSLAMTAGAAQLVQGGAVAQVMLSGGTDGERYLVTVVGETAGGEEIEGEIEVVVVEETWATPDGGAPWLSIAAFIRKVGLDEVLRNTDPDGSGRVDRDLVIEALTDAQAIAEANIAGRYALPLPAVPRVVEMAIADIARARLFRRGDPPKSIEDAGKAAVRLLENIATGKTTLGVPAAEAPAAPVSDAPVLIAPGRRQYPDGLAGY